MAPIQFGSHCLASKAAVTRDNLLPTGHAIKCPKLTPIVEHTCRNICPTVDLPSAALSATNVIDTPCISLKRVTTNFFSTPMDSLQCV